MIVAEDFERRERLQKKLEQVLAEQFPGRTRVAARAGAAGGLAAGAPNWADKLRSAGSLAMPEVEPISRSSYFVLVP